MPEQKTLPVELRQKAQSIAYSDNDPTEKESFICELLSQAVQKAKEEALKEAIDLVTEIKNMSADETPQDWFDALYCVRDSLTKKLQKET